jgi:hypothetical protein
VNFLVFFRKNFATLENGAQRWYDPNAALMARQPSSSVEPGGMPQS